MKHQQRVLANNASNEVAYQNRGGKLKKLDCMKKRRKKRIVSRLNIDRSRRYYLTGCNNKKIKK